MDPAPGRALFFISWNGASIAVDTVSEQCYNSITDTVSTTRKERIIMFKGTPDIIAQRREEIVNACEELYQTMSFRDINLKEIGNVTSFSRPTIYNYFHTKEEIFLALFEREYVRWNVELESILNSDDSLSRKEIAEMIAGSLERRPQLLRLLSMNNYDMEANSREELLASFKRAYGRSLDLFRSILEKHCPDMPAKEVEELMYVFFPFMFGIYPYAKVMDKQRKAMEEAEVDYRYHSIYEIAYNCLIRLFDK
jgi:AcrR family transcriptional regulator